VAAFSIAEGRIRIGDALFVYLQRAFAPAGRLEPGAVPRPHGVAPMAVRDAGVVAPVGDGEAIWLGFQAVDRERPVTVRVRLEREPPLDAVTGEPWEDGLAERNHLVCPPESRLVGVPAGGGVRPFGAGELAVLAWVPEPAEVAVRLVPPGAFTELTGEVPEPIDPDSAYGGQRLP
jgi:hypothetical protein